jgi:peptidyl-prolyl cis-trans isomerase A (cyclophilin A)
LENTTNPQVEIVTEFGTIVLEIAQDVAPITAANFLSYVDSGAYNNTSFYRTVLMDNQPDNDVKIEVIQGGLGMTAVTGPLRNQPIPLERTEKTGLKHVDGTLSMARLAADSATSEFFICINDQPELNYGGKRYADGQGFAAFGHVVSGQDVVRKIQVSAHEKQELTPNIAILKVQRVG